MGTTEYRRKRNFKKTPEPTTRRKKGKEAIFVIQEHHASHLHYDFRLEAFGTLKSWAVPKGPPIEVGERRLAVEVEDHPLSYASFKGRIPKGEYGAGIVKIWDHGTWQSIKPLRQSFKDGKIEIELKGKKLKGRWILVRSKKLSGKKAQWLLIKGHDAEKENKKNKAVKKGTSGPFLKEIRPQLALLSDTAPLGEEWLHEIKLDGYRTLAMIQNKKVTLRTRKFLDWTDKYGAVANELKKLPIKNAIIDGEIVVRDAEGRTSFNELQEALSAADDDRLEYFAFDLLYLNGRDLRAEPLWVRKELLEDILGSHKGECVVFSEHVRSQGQELFKKACSLGLEGIISKHREKPYHMSRTSDWLKVKCIQRQEFVIGGYTNPEGSRVGFGALLLGVYEKGHLRYVGRVGTGFRDGLLRELVKKMEPLKVSKSSFDLNSPKTHRNIHWLRPSLVAEIEFRSWTGDGILRHASFISLRSDKPAKEIKKEVPMAAKKSSKVEEFSITSPDRVLYVKDKFKKIDVANYYKSIAPVFLKYTSGRPLALLRCVDNTQSGCFFQKHLGNAKASDVKEKAVRDQEYMYIESETGLLQLVQSGAIEFHLWQSSHGDADSPNQIVFDLDPDESLPWKYVVEGAFRLKEILEGLSLKSFVKTTGGKGLHVQVPIADRYDFDAVKDFSKTVCAYMAQENPDRYVVNMSKKLRVKKIFLDYLRNGFGATAIAPFSLRAKEHPFVSVPITWNELKKMKKLKRYLPKDVLRRVAQLKKDPWAGYAQLKQRIKVLEKSGGRDLTEMTL